VLPLKFIEMRLKVINAIFHKVVNNNTAGVVSNKKFCFKFVLNLMVYFAKYLEC